MMIGGSAFVQMGGRFGCGPAGRDDRTAACAQIQTARLRLSPGGYVQVAAMGTILLTANVERPGGLSAGCTVHDYAYGIPCRLNAKEPVQRLRQMRQMKRGMASWPRHRLGSRIRRPSHSRPTGQIQPGALWHR